VKAIPSYDDIMVFADALLAQRLEAAEAANARGCSPRGPSVLEVAGGCAIFTGADSPLTRAVGIGLNGAVTEAQIGAVDTFFRSRGARPTIDLCPLAGSGLLQALGERGYCPTEFNNVLVKRLARSEIVLTPRVRRALAGEDDPWSYAVGRGFFGQPGLSTEEMDVGRAIFAMPGAMCYLGSRRPAPPPEGPRWPFAMAWRPCLPTPPSRSSAVMACIAS